MAIYAQIVDGLIVNRAVFAGEMPDDWPDREAWALAEDGMEIGAVLTKDGWAVPRGPEPEPERRLVPKRIIIDRLHAAGLLDIARKALDAAPLYTRERWNVRDAVFADDPETIGFLRLIGADPETILAP